MNESIKLVVLGDPKAQKRHRSVRMGKHIRQYDPSAADKADFLSMVQKNAPSKPFDQPLRVDLNLFFSRPKSHYRTGANSELLKENSPIWHTSKPDVDNCIKGYMDALNKVFWRDDSVICRVSILKQYSNSPRVEILITPL